MKTIRLFILALSAALVLGVAASASENAQSGIFGIVSRDDVVLTPAGEASAATVDGQAVADFYAGADTLTITYRAAKNNTGYTVLVTTAPTAPTQKNLVYFGAAAASGGEVVFERVYPTRLYNGHTYYIYIVGGGKSFNAAAPDASFRYYAPFLAGDFDGDGKITALDASCALALTRSAAAVDIGGESVAVTEAMKRAADADGDGAVTATDAALILQWAVRPEIR